MSEVSPSPVREAIAGSVSVFDAYVSARDSEEAAFNAEHQSALASAQEQHDADQAEIARLNELVKELTPVPPPDVEIDFTDLAELSVYNGVGNYSSQGPRIKQNVELLTEGERSLARVHVRPITAPMTVGGKKLVPPEYAAGGFSIPATKQQYGRLTFSGRASGPSSVDTRYAVMWWGVGDWPESGELDFWEAGANYPRRDGMKITNHWANAAGKNTMESHEVLMDFTQWHDFEIIWEEDLFVVSIDGVEQWRTTEHVPANTMYFAVQTAIEGGSPIAANGTPGYIDVADLKFWKSAA